MLSDQWKLQVAGLSNRKKHCNWLLCTLFIFLVFCCFQSGKALFANLHFYAAKNIIKPLQDEDADAFNTDLSSAQKHALNAVSLHGDLALYTDMVSTIKQWQAFISNDSEKMKLLLDEAETFNLMSLQNRPGWPVTWANLAYIKWHKKEFDDDFLRYIQFASKYGPNTPEVHDVITRIGLYLFESDARLFLSIKDIVKQHIIRGFNHPKTKRTLVNVVNDSGARIMVCSWLNGAYENENLALSCK